MNTPIVIHDRTEGKRGCGYRKAGGKYLVCMDGIAQPCGKLPIALTVCPCCSAGIKPSRGWTWVDADALATNRVCHTESRRCVTCPLAGRLGKAGLLWIGEKFYPTPGDFTAEAMKMGVSRRLHQVPREFVIGKTWVLVAHRKAIIRTDLKSAEHPAGKPEAGIFHAFKPTAIEYIIKGDESEDELRDMMKRGFTLVRVTRDDGRPLGAPTEDDGDE